MRVIRSLWDDEVGVLLSAEAVALGTVAVVGLTAGVTTLATSVNEELKDVAYAIRSLDQSYSIPGMEGCGAMTAGSSFTQTPVELSLDQLDETYRQAEDADREATQLMRESQQATPQADRLERQMQRQNKKRNSEHQRKRRLNTDEI